MIKKTNAIPLKPGTLLKLSDRWQHISLYPLNHENDLRGEAIKYLAADHWANLNWRITKDSPPLLFLETTFSQISPTRYYGPSEIDKAFYIHKLLHAGKVCIFVTEPEFGLTDFFIPATENRSWDQYLKKHFGDLYNPCDWKP